MIFQSFFGRHSRSESCHTIGTQLFSRYHLRWRSADIDGIRPQHGLTTRRAEKHRNLEPVFLKSHRTTKSSGFLCFCSISIPSFQRCSLSAAFVFTGWIRARTLLIRGDNIKQWIVLRRETRNVSVYLASSAQT